MNAEQLNQALYDKMAAEQERFKHNLLGLSTEEVLNHAYEYAMRQDILVEMRRWNSPPTKRRRCWPRPPPWQMCTGSGARWKPTTWRIFGM